MLKHNGVYWYWKDGAWCRVLKAHERPVPHSRWPASYSRATCVRCRRRLPDKGMYRYCSQECANRAKAARQARHQLEQVKTCQLCARRTANRISSYCSACFRRLPFTQSHAT